MALPSLLCGAWQLQEVSITVEADTLLESSMDHDCFAGCALRLCLFLLVSAYGRLCGFIRIYNAL